MDTTVKRLYEAMFLIDSAEAASDWEGVNMAIETILKRAEAEIVSIRKWDECKLTYEVNHKARGTYILCYFSADGGKIREIERDVQLSERIMRVLILNAEHMSREDIEQDTPATRVEKRSQQIAQGRTDEAKVEKTTAPEKINETEEVKSLRAVGEQSREDV